MSYLSNSLFMYPGASYDQFYSDKCDGCKLILKDLDVFYYLDFDGGGDVMCGPCMKENLNRSINGII